MEMVLELVSALSGCVVLPRCGQREQRLLGICVALCASAVAQDCFHSELSQGFGAHPLVLLRVPKGCWTMDCI